MAQPRTIALAGVGDLGRYLLEELASDDRYQVAVLTRKKDQKYENPKITTHPTDYSENSVLSILDSTGATALISTIRCPDASYIPLHRGFLNACRRSTTCKRFIPSEWAGNIEDYPDVPRAYGKTRAPFRQILREEAGPGHDDGGGNGVEWTLFNHGWFMDYFVGEDRSYMKYLPGEFPITLKTWEYVVRGTGDELQSWTCGRDVAKAVAELLGADHWEPVTYVTGEWSTYNQAAALMEGFYDRPLARSYRSASSILQSLEELNKRSSSSPSNDDEEVDEELALAEGEEWQISGATACPKEKTMRQREIYFGNVKFLGIEELLRKAKEEGRV